MSVRIKLQGIYILVITPFFADCSVDFGSLPTLIERPVGAGVHCLISGGSTGENYTETVEERLAIARFTLGQVKGRIPVMIGTGAMRTPDSIALVQGARDMGADGILLAIPLYSMPNERENALNALAIDRVAGPPILLCNYPGRMGVSLGQEFPDRVGRSKNVTGIKESSGDNKRIHLPARDHPHIQMSCDMNDQALEFFAWSAQSWVCGGSDFLPEEHIALYETCVIKGDFAKVCRIVAAMLPLMAVLGLGGKVVAGGFIEPTVMEADRA